MAQGRSRVAGAGGSRAPKTGEVNAVASRSGWGSGRDGRWRNEGLKTWASGAAEVQVDSAGEGQ